MGGYGSGNRWNSKTTTESQHRIDIRWLKKQGYLRPDTMGTLSWSWRDKQTGSIGYRMEADRMVSVSTMLAPDSGFFMELGNTFFAATVII